MQKVIYYNRKGGENEDAINHTVVETDKYLYLTHFEGVHFAAISGVTFTRNNKKISATQSEYSASFSG